MSQGLKTLFQRRAHQTKPFNSTCCQVTNKKILKVRDILKKRENKFTTDLKYRNQMLPQAALVTFIPVTTSERPEDTTFIPQDLVR